MVVGSILLVTFVGTWHPFRTVDDRDRTDASAAMIGTAMCTVPGMAGSPW